MKYLSDYMSERQSALFKETNTFFAFSEKQIQEGLAETKLTKKDICHMGMGMYCEKKHSDYLFKSLEDIYKDSIKIDIEENGLPAIIERELANHEAYYTGDIDTTMDSLEDYPVTTDDVIKIFRQKQYDPETNMNVSV